MPPNEGKGRRRIIHGKPYEGKLHVRIDEGSPETGCLFGYRAGDLLYECHAVQLRVPSCEEMF